MKKIKVAELFAGVGGFRIGLEGFNNKSASSDYKDELNSMFEVVWSNQFEPSTKTQYASQVYENRFGKETHINQDIATVDVSMIPDHDLLCGGFPCQDYSVASSLKNSKGLIGKKGVLWWSIHKILSEKENKPKYLLLENVDRLLISPSSQRGRDFAIILKSLNDLGYAVEWRVINAAEYGMSQRRKRTYIVAYHNTADIYNDIKNTSYGWLLQSGVLVDAFPVATNCQLSEFDLKGDLVDISNNFNKIEKNTFENTGLMINGEVLTIKTVPNYRDGFKLLKDVLFDGLIPSDYYIEKDDLHKWSYLKGAKSIMRVNPIGVEYKYTEGSMGYPDSIEKPSRTIITGEGGKAPSRFKHVIDTENGYRRLLPIELERLNMFPDNHTELKGVSDTKRAFFMGNALVIGIVEKIGKSLEKRL